MEEASEGMRVDDELVNRDEEANGITALQLQARTTRARSER
jgi:hypothetical protein